MDRTVIMPYRAEERELSHTLYNAIQGLFLLYPPTEDMRKCLSDEMFIKPNQQAFFHVMHYLFRILDPQEFKKRFFWPITDKRSESNFRTSTVEYLKNINEKHQLNWTNIKSYLVVMPGGMKFIVFLLDLVNFVVQELIKQKEKQLDANNYRSQISEASLYKMCAKNEFFKNMASEFLDTIENLNTKYDERSQKVMKYLKSLSHDSGLSLDLLTDDKFHDAFNESNRQLFNKYYTDRSKKIFEMDNMISELKESIDKFYSKEMGYKYDKERICQQLKRIRDHFPVDEWNEESFGSKVTDEAVNINTLITTFNGINETIQNELKVINKKPCVGEFVYSRLLSLKKELQDMETQITNFKKLLHDNIQKSTIEFPKTPSGEVKQNVENNLFMKLISTPPIKFELPENDGKPRLALIDSKTVNTNEITFNNFLAPPSASIMRQPNRNHSLLDQTISDPNNSLNRSKIIDPIQLLRSTSKRESSKYKISTTQVHISKFGSNWKLHQAIVGNNGKEALTVSITTPETEINMSSQSVTQSALHEILYQSPFTPLSSNDRTKITRLQYQSDSSETDLNECNSPYLNHVKKLSAVKKVQDASLNIANLSTSPSGRLEPLVAAEHIDVPKLKINDITIIEHNTDLKKPEYEKPNLFANIKQTDDHVHVYDETNYKSCNDNKQTTNDPVNEHEIEEEALFNISDSVLNDVTL